MNELQQVWRERIDWVQASGLTIAEASEELGVSVGTTAAPLAFSSLYLSAL